MTTDFTNSFILNSLKLPVITNIDSLANTLGLSVVRQNIALCNCNPKSNYNYNTNNYLVVICFFTKQIITITKLLMT